MARELRILHPHSPKEEVGLPIQRLVVLDQVSQAFRYSNSERTNADKFFKKLK